MSRALAEHLDAFISIAAGIWCCFIAYRPSPKLSSERLRKLKPLKVLGPLVLLFGAFRFFMVPPDNASLRNREQSPGNGSAMFPPVASETIIWKRHLTPDGVASAEFPVPPTLAEKTDTLDGVSVQRTTQTCDVPRSATALNLSSSPRPPGEPVYSAAELMAGMKATMSQQGFTVLREAVEQFGSTEGFALDYSKDGKTTWMRAALVNQRLYRIVVTSSSLAPDSSINRFLKSFRIEK